jgi:hypothetical protein
MSRRPGNAEHLWPPRQQRLLLEAALSGPERAIPAFHAWQSQVDLEGELGWSVVRLFPLVYHNLHSHGVCDPLMGRFKGVYRRAWYESHQLRHQTGPVPALLVANRIEVMLLDGAPLALSYYDHPALRPMASIALMVRRQQVRPAIQLLQQAGWRPTRDATDDHLRFADSLQFLGPDGGAIDLHWHVLEGSPNEESDDACWQSSEPVDWQGTPVRQLDATGLLTRALLQGVRWDGESSLSWIPDALVVLRRRPAAIDWERFVRVADQHRLTHRLALACAYLARTFGPAVPAAVEARLASHRARLLERIADAGLLANRRQSPDRPTPNAGGLLAEFSRYAWRARHVGNPVSMLLGFSHYLRYQWGLSGRRDILPTVLRGLRSRALPVPALTSKG